MRALDAIHKVRLDKNGRDLFEQLHWRLRLLGGSADFIDSGHRFAFEDVLDVYAPDGYTLVLDAAAPCRATLDRGGVLEFSGRLVTEGVSVAELERRLHFEHRFADHRRLRVIPRYRGNRLAPRSLIRSVALYDSLGFEYVHVRAAYSGRWYWAEWGFHFEQPSDLAAVQNHVQEVADAFGGGLDATTLTHPIQFARLGEPVEITFDHLCDVFPQRRDGYEEIATQNGLGLHDPVPFGRLVMLTGPSWYGRLDLAGGDRLIFDDKARRVLEALEGAS